MIKFSLSDDGTSDISLMTDGETSQGFVSVGDKRFDSLAALVKAYPALATSEKLIPYCAVCTHLANQGFGFLVIEDAEEYRERYLNIVAYGDSATDDGPTTAADFGPFDVREIAPPRIAGGKLVYYVEDATYNLPYRVETAWPAKTDEPINFRLLPLQE